MYTYIWQEKISVCWKIIYLLLPIIITINITVVVYLYDNEV